MGEEKGSALLGNLAEEGHVAGLGLQRMLLLEHLPFTECLLCTGTRGGIFYICITNL